MPWVPDSIHTVRCTALLVEPTTPASMAEARYLLASRAREELRWKLKKSPEFAKSGSLQRALLDLEVLCECLAPDSAVPVSEPASKPKRQRRRAS